MKVLDKITGQRLINPVSFKDVSSADVFDPREKFIVGGNVDGVLIAGINDAFSENFLCITEKDVPKGKLQICRLNPGKTATDSAIITELMLKDQNYLDFGFKVSLFHIWELLREQPNGQNGELTTGDGEKNIFFYRNTEGVIKPIQIYWKKEKKQGKELLNSGWIAESYSGWIAESYPEASSSKKKKRVFTPLNKVRSEDDQIFHFQKAV